MNITADKASNGRPSAAHRSRPSFRGPAMVGAALAVVLAALGIPRLGAAMAGLDAQDVLWNLRNGARYSAEALGSAAGTLEDAGRWLRDGETEADRGFLLLNQALRMEPGRERTELFARSEEATAQAMAAAPGHPGAWARLAYLREMRGDRAGAAQALRLSWLAGGFVPPMMVSRLELALRLLPVMDSDMRSLLSRQIRLTWVIAPDAVAGLATQDALAPLVRDALAELSEDEVKRYLAVQGRRP